MEILVVLVVILAFGALMFSGRSYEVRDYNDCGIPWRHYDNDSQGGRGYTCDTCSRGVWVSYPGVDV